MDDHLSNEDYARVREVARDPRRTTRSSINEQRAMECAVGYAGETTRPASTLEEIANRIYAAVGRISGITDLMTDHADRLHGCDCDEIAGRAEAEPVPSSQVARIFQALEHLDRAVDNNAYAAGRNINIA